MTTKPKSPMTTPDIVFLAAVVGSILGAFLTDAMHKTLDYEETTIETAEETEC